MKAFLSSPPDKQFWTKVLGFIISLGFVTAILSALELLNTIDENVYVKAGLDYLNTLSFAYNHEHPPLSKWLGALPAWLLSSDELFYFRISHVILFFYGGLFFSTYLKKTYSVSIAVLFALLYFFDPNIKSMAALHINDFDVALFIGLSAFYVFRFYTSEVFSKRLLFFAFFFFVLAINSKFTGLFYGPFLMVALYARIRLESKNGESSFQPYYLWIPALATALAFLISYLFQVDEVLWYGKGIDAQRLHNRAATHPAFLWGEIRNDGFWSYYLVSLWAKLPLGHWLLWIASFVMLFKMGVKKHLPLIAFVLAPAILLLIHLSSLNVQTGLRYYLPGVILLHLFCVFIWGDFFKNKQFSNWILIASVVVIVNADLWTFYKHSYISYFNFWTPNPTRNFGDANIDWRQGLPQRVKKRLPEHIEWKQLRPSLMDNKERINVLVGARELSGTVSLRAPLLRMYKPAQVIGGYELHTLSKNQVLEIFSTPVSSAKKALEYTRQVKP